MYNVGFIVRYCITPPEGVNGKMSKSYKVTHLNNIKWAGMGINPCMPNKGTETVIFITTLVARTSIQ